MKRETTTTTTTMFSSRTEKDWKFSSFDQTVSTIESDGLSVDSDIAEFDVPLIIEASSRNNDSNRVTFADEEGSDLCFVKEVARIGDASLWWTPEECSEIIKECSKAVAYYQGRPRLCTSMTNLLLFRWIDESHPLDAILDLLEEQDPEVLARGLEQHIVGSSKHYVARHRNAVLDAQDDIRGTSHEDSIEGMLRIGNAAAMTANDCKDLARRIALYDEVEASLEELEEEESW